MAGARLWGRSAALLDPFASRWTSNSVRNEFVYPGGVYFVGPDARHAHSLENRVEVRACCQDHLSSTTPDRAILPPHCYQDSTRSISTDRWILHPIIEHVQSRKRSMHE
jgi:hypothetical protein